MDVCVLLFCLSCAKVMFFRQKKENAAIMAYVWRKKGV